MSDQDKSLKNKKSFQMALFKASGLNLTDEITEVLLNSESLSLEQLRKYYTLDEIGNALISLESYCVPCDGVCECITIPGLGIKCCLSSLGVPADNADEI